MIYNNFNFNERQPFIPNEMNNMMNNISFQPKANFFNPIINDFVNMIPYYYKINIKFIKFSDYSLIALKN